MSEVAEAPANPSGKVAHHGLITLSIMLATIMQALDTTIANVALPHMAGSLSASQDQIAWVLTSYIVAAAIATPLTGWLTGQFGRKRIFMISVVGFTAASALCGIAGSLFQIVMARLLQGLFGAALVPLSQAVMLDINPKERHGQAMAIWGMGVMVGPILGPTLGGWLTDNLSWRWVFFINLPVGIFCFYGIYTYIKETVIKSSQFDFMGFVTLSLSIGMLQLMLDRGEQLDWFNSIEICIEGIGALVAFAYFLAHTFTKGKGSFFNMQLLKDRNYATGLIFMFVVGLILYATRALLPPLLQTLMGYPVVTTGLVTGPSGIGTMLAMMIAGKLVNRIDPRALIACGFGLMAFSLWQMSGYNLDMGEGPIVWPGFFQGMGLGFVTVPLTTIAFSTLNPVLRPDGTSIFSLSRNIGSSIGISVMQTLLTRNTSIAHAALVGNISLYNPMVQAPYAPPIYDLHSYAGLSAINAEVTRQASLIAYLDDFKFMMLATIVTTPLLLLMRRKTSQGKSAEPEVAVLE
ncbi:MAG TPA: DHA2 family efflux MFS transporter permease subunit [Rhodocyclaceae bacterium]|nr:DHA2 family efflux MFS transporter permease subunit [Rhodocyclaceae bacterium]